MAVGSGGRGFLWDPSAGSGPHKPSVTPQSDRSSPSRMSLLTRVALLPLLVLTALDAEAAPGPDCDGLNRTLAAERLHTVSSSLSTVSTQHAGFS